MSRYGKYLNFGTRFFVKFNTKSSETFQMYITSNLETMYETLPTNTHSTHMHFPDEIRD